MTGIHHDRYAKPHVQKEKTETITGYGAQTLLED